MNPYETTPVSDLGLHCLTKRLLKHFSRRQKQTTFVVIGALRFKAFNMLYGWTGGLNFSPCLQLLPFSVCKDSECSGGHAQMYSLV